MKDTSREIRERIVTCYLSEKSGTYKQTAEIFCVITSTVNRILRRSRETGSLEKKARGGNNPRHIQLDWLE